MTLTIEQIEATAKAEATFNQMLTTVRPEDRAETFVALTNLLSDRMFGTNSKI